MELIRVGTRRDCLKAASIAFCLSYGPAWAQPATESSGRRLREIFEAAVRLGSFILQASDIAKRKDISRELLAFAEKLGAARQAVLMRWEAVGVQERAPKPADLPEQISIIQNLAPLNGLEFSRRFLDVIVQALQQEQIVYRMVSRHADPLLRGFADRSRELEAEKSEAHRLIETVTAR
jgi:hypothetical protein